MPRSTTHRTADRMIRLGWLDKPADRYRIGNRLFEIASLAPIRLELREAVLPFLQDLHQATKITVQLGVLDGTQILVVEKITGHRAMPMLVTGRRHDPGVLLGARPRDPRLLRPGDHRRGAGRTAGRRTPRTLTSPVAIMRELTAVPDRGWAIEREEGNIGVSCVAAPIFGPLGEVAAALSVTGPSQLVRADRIGPAVRLAAAAASRAYTSRPRLPSR